MTSSIGLILIGDPHSFDARNDACSPYVAALRTVSCRHRRSVRRHHGDDNVIETTYSTFVSMQLASLQVARDTSLRPDKRRLTWLSRLPTRVN